MSDKNVVTSILTNALVLVFISALGLVFSTNHARAASDPPAYAFIMSVALGDVTTTDMGVMQPPAGPRVQATFPLASPEGTVDMPLDTAFPGLKETVDSTSARFWTLTIRKNLYNAVTMMNIDYSVTGLNKQPGVFSSRQDPSSFIPVTVKPQPLAMVDGKNNWVISQAVSFLMNMSHLKRSGTYEGRVTTTITLTGI